MDKNKSLMVFEGSIIGEKSRLTQFKRLLIKLVTTNKGEVKINQEPGS